MLELFQKGGPVMWLIAATGACALGVFLERIVYYHRISIHTGDFLRGLANLIDRGNLSEALEECATLSGPVARVAHSVLLQYKAPPEEIRATASEAAQLEVAKLEKNLRLLSAMILTAPLLGLLGTALGMLDVFQQLSIQGGITTSSDLAMGMYQSLITTAAALCVCIPAYLAHCLLSARVDQFIREMELAGI
ncbi:MAG: MotA/TolQ/ExbB proton channel family protein, partial [Chthoniobacterales bacterium]|nr:MotA/TolQ/ExbB proton channel family protein [Chthoniobacterales bacterium]